MNIYIYYTIIGDNNFPHPLSPRDRALSDVGFGKSPKTGAATAMLMMAAAARGREGREGRGEDEKSEREREREREREGEMEKNAMKSPRSSRSPTGGHDVDGVEGEGKSEEGDFGGNNTINNSSDGGIGSGGRYFDDEDATDA